MGEIGERLAAWFLAGKGLDVLEANLDVAGGEIDLIAIDHGVRVVVEVRTTTSSEDPIDAVGAQKRARVRALAARVGAERVDLVGIRLDEGGVDIHWVPGSS